MANETRIPSVGEEYPAGSGAIITKVEPVPGERECVVNIYRKTPNGSDVLQYVDYCFLPEYSGGLTGTSDEVAQAMAAAGVFNVTTGSYTNPDGGELAFIADGRRLPYYPDPYNTPNYRFLDELRKINPNHHVVTAAAGMFSALDQIKTDWDRYLAYLQSRAASAEEPMRSILMAQYADYAQRRAGGEQLALTTTEWAEISAWEASQSTSLTSPTPGVPTTVPTVGLGSSGCRNCTPMSAPTGIEAALPAPSPSAVSTQQPSLLPTNTVADAEGPGFSVQLSWGLAFLILLVIYIYASSR